MPSRLLKPDTFGCKAAISACGNGGRCIVAYAHKLGLIGVNTKFKAIDGYHKAQVISNNQVRLKMNDISNISY